jgi:hypothetical protein
MTISGYGAIQASHKDTDHLYTLTMANVEMFNWATCNETYAKVDGFKVRFYAGFAR